MQPHFIGCDSAPQMSQDSQYVMCPAIDTTTYLESEVATLYSPPISIAQAHVIGSAVFMLLFASYYAKKTAGILRGWRND